MNHFHENICGKNWVGRDHQIHHCILSTGNHKVCECGCEARKYNMPVLKDLMPNREMFADFFSRLTRGKYRPRPSFR